MHHGIFDTPHTTAIVIIHGALYLSNTRFSSELPASAIPILIMQPLPQPHDLVPDPYDRTSQDNAAQSKQLGSAQLEVQPATTASANHLVSPSHLRPQVKLHMLEPFPLKLYHVSFLYGR